ncbi:hypothetical protein Tco_1430401 [Tanacetum coccineum]
MLKTTGNSSKKDNISMSNSFFALNEEDEEDVENVYDESANLFQNKKDGGSSSFTATAVCNNSKRVNHQNFGRFSHPNPKSNIVPQAVLTKSGLVSLNTAKSVSTAQSRKTMNDVMPTTYSYYKAYSSVKRPFNKKTTNYNRYFNKRVNTVKSTRVNTARPKAEVNTVKASASWVWKPKHEELDHVSKSNSTSKTLTRYDYVDAYERFKSVLAWDFKRH